MGDNTRNGLADRHAILTADDIAVTETEPLKFFRIEEPMAHDPFRRRMRVAKTPLFELPVHEDAL